MNPLNFSRSLYCISLVFALIPLNAYAAKNAGAKVIQFFGHDLCIELKNKTTRVVLSPSGGRVLVYEIDGKNALYLSDSDRDGKGGSSAGRFDIGPEKILPRHDLLWNGVWKGEITGARLAKLTSGKDSVSGFQIVRQFHLDAKTSRLLIKQTVINISSETRQVCYWCRTFALGQGICVVPVTGHSRMPKKHVIYEDGTTINFMPDDGNIQHLNGFIIVKGPPRKPKLGFDSKAGWMAYLMPNNTMFVKRWQVFPNRPYGEMAGLTLSIWYPAGAMCELEPIGPREILKPGEKASFVEEWWLTLEKFPSNDKPINLPDLVTKMEVIGVIE